MNKISLEAARRNARLTQEELAYKMGVSRKSVHNWESGKVQIKRPYFIAFCAITGFSEDDLLCPESSQNEN